MSLTPAPHAPPSQRSTWVAALVLLVLAGFCGTIAYLNWPAADPASQPVAAADIASQTASPSDGPAFDIVRVGPQGRAVIAGRAESGAEVTVRDGNRILGRTRANDQGLFVLLPEAGLPAGARELTLSARGADGIDAPGTDSVFLMVPEPPEPASDAAPAPALAVLLPPPGAAAPRLLNAPPARDRKLSLDTVDYDSHGEIRFAGSARPGTSIRLYVDDRAVGDARTDTAGQWSLSPPTSIATGVHKLRVDQLGADGKVVARIELPFQRTAATAAATSAATGAEPTPERTVVQPGQTLWRIARQTYGKGVRYTVIYSANRDQIRDPNRIYPGQIFAVPPGS